jgi:hypothetical protein
MPKLPKFCEKRQTGVRIREDAAHPLAAKHAARTPRPSPQSQSFSRSYGSILPTSLIYIVLSTRGCAPWRPDAVMSTTRGENKNSHPDFQGPTGAHRTARKLCCFASLPTLSPTKSIPGCGRKTVKKKRELFPGPTLMSPGLVALPQSIHVLAREY